MESNQKNIVYYDGSCPLCIAAVDTIDTGEATLQKVDITTAEIPKDLDLKKLDRDLHVVTGGVVRTGVDAVALLLDERLSTRWCSRLVRMPLLRQLAQILYWLISRNRHHISGLFPRTH